MPITWLWPQLRRHKIVFWIYVTIFVRSSVFLLILWVHDAFDFRLRVIKWIGIQLAFIQCAHHVVMKSLVTSQSHFPKSITWFSYCCFLTSFMIACWILPPVITHQMNGHQISFRFTYALFGYDVTCPKLFSKSVTRFSQDLLSSYTCISAFCIYLSVTKYQTNWHPISFYLMYRLCGYESFMTSQSYFPKSITWFS